MTHRHDWKRWILNVQRKRVRRCPYFKMNWDIERTCLCGKVKHERGEALA
jgi:hypothetical protein